MLARIPELVAEIRGTPEARRGVLVKRPKPQQERRIDLPTIGVSHRRAARPRRALPASRSRLARRSSWIARQVATAADAAGIFVYGFTAAELA